MSKRKYNGDGSIYKRKDGRWCAAYFDNEPTPKRHYIYGKSQKEVKKKLQAKLHDLELGISNLNIPTDLGGWIQYYLENYKIHEIKITTYSLYYDNYVKHIKDKEIAKKPIDIVTTHDLQIYYNKLLADGYNVKTIKQIKTIINAALSHAEKLKMIPYNPNQYVSLPRKKKYEPAVLTNDEIRTILVDAKKDELYPIIALTLTTGLRKGEVMALHWSDIDFENNFLRVKYSLCRVHDTSNDSSSRKYSYQILEPKTTSSKRIVPLNSIAITALEMQRTYQNELKEKYASIYNDQGLVFARYDGLWLNQRPFMTDFHAFLERYGIQPIRFHDLRHGFASFLLSQGETPKMIQELLGHSTITTTLDIYSHIYDASKVKTLKAFDNIYNKK